MQIELLETANKKREEDLAKSENSVSMFVIICKYRVLQNNLISNGLDQFCIRWNKDLISLWNKFSPFIEEVNKISFSYRLLLKISNMEVFKE